MEDAVAVAPEQDPVEGESVPQTEEEGEQQESEEMEQ